jgi:hypothetical protein
VTYIPDPPTLAKRHEKDILGAVAMSLSIDLELLQLMPEESFLDATAGKCGFLVLGPNGLIGVHAAIDAESKLVNFSCRKV